MVKVDSIWRGSQPLPEATSVLQQGSAAALAAPAPLSCCAGSVVDGHSGSSEAVSSKALRPSGAQEMPSHRSHTKIVPDHAEAKSM